MLVEASAWLRQKGLAQWSPEYPSDRFAREVASGCVWYWSVAGEPIATVTLHESRPEYYPRDVWQDKTAAWYLSRFAVARRLAGQRVGELVLDGVERDAVAAGARVLRLDVTTANPFLGGYYLAHGFERYQLVEIFGEPSALFEKTLGGRQ